MGNCCSSRTKQYDYSIPESNFLKAKKLYKNMLLKSKYKIFFFVYLIHFIIKSLKGLSLETFIQ